jgi:hypothetical protein
MAFLNNVEFWYVKCDPSRPNPHYNKENPTWEVQIRTHDRAQAKEWEAQNLSLKAVIPDPEKDSPEVCAKGPYWKTVLRKKSRKKDGTPNGPVGVVNANLDPVDPNTIGNGSVGNCRIFQYPYPKGEGEGTATVLMEVQVVRHKLYTPTRETFGRVEGGEVIAETPKQMEGNEGETPAQEATPSVPSGVPSGVPTSTPGDPSKVF